MVIQGYGKSAEGLECMRDLLEGAMMYGYNIRVVYQSQVYEGQVRFSKHHPLSRFHIKVPKAVEYKFHLWRGGVNDPDKEGWMELFIDLHALTEVRSSGGDPYDD
jgi:hypothetical protein